MSTWTQPENLLHQHPRQHLPANPRHSMQGDAYHGVQGDDRDGDEEATADVLPTIFSAEEAEEGQEYVYLGTSLGNPGSITNGGHRHQDEGDDDVDAYAPEDLKAYERRLDTVLERGQASFLSLVLADREDDDFERATSADDSIEANPSFPDDFLISSILKTPAKGPPTEAPATPQRGGAGDEAHEDLERSGNAQQLLLESSPHRTPTPKLSNVGATAAGVAPSQGIIDLTGLPDDSAAPAANGRLTLVLPGSSPAQPIAVESTTSAGIAAAGGGTERADGSSPMTPIAVDGATSSASKNHRPPRTPAPTPGSPKSSSAKKARSERPSVTRKTLPSPSPPPVPPSTTKKRSRASPKERPTPTSASTSAPPTPTMLKSPNPPISPTTAFFMSLAVTERLSRPTAASSIRAERKKSSSSPPKALASPKSLHEANKETILTGHSPGGGANADASSPSAKNGSAAPATPSHPAGASTAATVPPQDASNGIVNGATKPDSSQKRGFGKRNQLTIDTGAESTPAVRSFPDAAGSPVASAIEASRRVSPKISSPTDSPDFALLARLMQPTAASQARASREGGVLSPTSMAGNAAGSKVPSPRKSAGSCESCSTGTPSKSTTLPPTATSPQAKVSEPSSRLMSETASSKAHHRSPLIGSPVQTPNAPSGVLPSVRVPPEEAAPEAPHQSLPNGTDAPPLDVGATPSNRLTSDTLSSKARHSLPTNERVPPSSIATSTPSPALLGRLTKETAASAARRSQEQHGSAEKSTSPPHVLHFKYNPDACEAITSPPSLQHGQEISISPSASVFSRLAQDTASSKARTASPRPNRPVERLARTKETRQTDSTSGGADEGTDPNHPGRYVLSSRDDEDEESHGIPNVCSSLTQDSGVSSTEFARQMEARQLAKRVASVRPVSSQSRLLQGTASSRAREGPPSDQIQPDEQDPTSHVDSARPDSSTLGSSTAAEHPPQAAMRAKRVSEGKENQTRTVSKRTVTIPVTPTFMRGARTKTSAAMPTLPESTLAQSTDTLRKTLRGDFKSSIIAKHSSGLPRKLTVPKTPNFATSKRPSRSANIARSEPEPTLAQSAEIHKRGLRSDSSLSSTSDLSKRRQPTIPKTSQLATTQRHGSESTAVKGTRGASLANSTDDRRTGLRTPFVSGGTQTTASTTRAKESAHIGASVARPRQENALRAVTKPVPFRFHTDKRSNVESRAKAAGLSTRDARDKEEMAKQFRARPAPRPSNRSFTGNVQNRSSFRAGAELATSQDDASDAACPITSPRDLLSSLSPLTPNSDDEWTIKAARRQQLAETARKNAQAMALQRERERKDRQREGIRQGILRSDARRLPVPANVKPFTLQSELRGEQHQRRFQEKLQREKEEQRRKASFHAREYSANPPPGTVALLSRRPDRIVTQSQPFQLRCVERHEQFVADRRQTLAAEEEDRRRHSQFKAKPVPHSTYGSPIISPSVAAGQRSLSNRSIASTRASTARRTVHPSR